MGTMFIEENLKSSTLPGKKAVNDSPEVMFQQEVAHFRYTLKEVRKRLVEETTSMEVNVPESMRRKPGFWNFQSDPEILMDIINFPADLVQHYSNPEKGNTFTPQVSDLDSSISEFGLIHCCKQGFSQKLMTEWQTVKILMR